MALPAFYTIRPWRGSAAGGEAGGQRQQQERGGFRDGNGGLAVTLDAGTSLQSQSSQHLGTLSLGNNASMTVLAGGNRMQTVSGLSLGTGATLDLADNNLVVQYLGSTGAGTYNTIRQWLQAGQLRGGSA